MPFGQPFQQHGPSKPKRCGQGPMGTMVSECGKLALGWAPAGDGTIDPLWSRSLWSECTASCGDTGVQVRDRTCSIPNRCEGEPSQSQSCNRTRQCFDLPPPPHTLLCFRFQLALRHLQPSLNGPNGSVFNWPICPFVFVWPILLLRSFLANVLNPSISSSQIDPLEPMLCKLRTGQSGPLPTVHNSTKLRGLFVPRWVGNCCWN